MRKATVIATCLVNSDMIRDLEHAELAVRRIFSDEFPSEDFDEWNQGIGDDVAEHIVETVGRASTINVAKFIEDLKHEPTP